MARPMILSSADILRVLGGDPIIRQEARISIVDSKPGMGLDEYVYIYIERYPAVDDFEATWRIWVQDGGSSVADLVLQALTRLLPKFDFHGTHYSTTEFKSKDTVVRPAEEIALEKVAAATGSIEQRFAALAADVRNKLSAVSNGRDGLDGTPGLDGKDGRDGRDGKDGRDLVATDAKLEDLQNVEQNIAKEDGQVLTWKDGVWQNLFIPQVISSISGNTAASSGQQTSLIGRGEWRYSASTAGDPANGRVQFNDADPSLATEIYINRYTSEGKDVYNLLTAVVTAGTLFYIQGGAADNYYLYDVTANAVQVGGTHILVPVTLRNQGIDAAFSFNQTIGLASYNYSGGGGGGIPEAPQDGNYYVRQNGSWVDLSTALGAIGITVDGGTAS